VDLFSGAGGLGPGFRNAGFDIAVAVDSDRNAAQTYRLNHPGVPVLETTIERSFTAQALRAYRPQLGDVDVILAGPPCQGYSMAGPRRIDDPRNGLFRHVSRLARELKASAVILENVPGVRRSKGHSYLPIIARSFSRSGYRVLTAFLNAAEFGVPQRRRRYFVIAYDAARVGAVRTPAPTHVPPGDGSSRSALPQTVRLIDALDRLEHHATAALEAGGHRVRLHNHEPMRHSAKVVSKIEGIAPGMGPISYRRLDPDLGRTIIAGHRALPVHPVRHRTITVREAAIIQGFPVTYHFLGPRSQQPLQVANAVPPALAEAVGRQVLHAMLASPVSAPATGSDADDGSTERSRERMADRRSSRSV